ncbi:MAG: SMI1/KNR4 family protein [Abitibacteriaceae bacterium]|nr:SMI1/KNR4 family protein [Abditibacteriaceae bacterium]
MHKQFKNDWPKFYQQLQSRKAKPVEAILPGATEAELQKLEEILGLPLPESYKRLLRCARGFWLRGGTIQFSSGHPFFHNFAKLEELTPRQLQTLRAKGGIWPPPSQGMLCFAEFFMEADGDQVLFDVSGGLQDGEYPIMYYAHEDNPPSVRKLADSFAQWMDEFLDYKEWS